MHADTFEWVKELTAKITNPQAVWETLFGLALWSDEEEEQPRTFWIRWQNDTQSVICARDMEELCDFADQEGDTSAAAFCELTPFFQLTQQKKNDPLMMEYEGQPEEGTPVNGKGEIAFIPLALWHAYESDDPAEDSVLVELIGENPETEIKAPPEKPIVRHRNESYRDRRKYLVEYRRRNKNRLATYTKKHAKKPEVKKQRQVYRQEKRDLILAQQKEYREQTKRWRLPVVRLKDALKQAQRAGKPSWVTDMLKLRLEKAKELLAHKLAKRKYNKRYNRLNAAKLQRTQTAKKEASALLEILATGQALQTLTPTPNK
jgi:hypothetical protein